MTMYSERAPIGFQAGLHNQSVSDLMHLGLNNRGLTIDGMPVSPDNYDHFIQEYGMQPEREIEIGAHNGDPQAERDAVHIAKHVINKGMSPWPSAPGAIPDEHLNAAANGLRRMAGIPEELPQTQQMVAGRGNDPEPEQEQEDKWEHIEHPYEDEPAEDWDECPNISADCRTPGCHHTVEGDEKKQASFSSETPAVSSEMSDQVVESKWHVVALGEMQQPGGVGATQDDYNPVTDGANPNGPNFMDNSGNSNEQERALETWTNLAVDMLNRGELEDAIIAQLAHDGCPDPQSVVQRALQQDQESPVSNEAGTDAFDMPIQNPDMGGNDSVSQAGHGDVYASVSEGDYVRIKRTGQRGKIVASFLDVWGDGIYKVALDSGKLVDLTPKQVTSITEIETPSDPLAEIQSWLDQMEPATDTRSSVETRITNLEKASLALHEARLARGASFSEQIRADKLKSDVDFELSGLRVARHRMQESDFDYLDALPKFTHNAYAIFEGEKVVDQNWTRRVAEDAAILVAELPDEMLVDSPGVELAAFHHAAANYASDEATDDFLIEVERLRVARVEANVSTQRTASYEDAFTPNEGPAEELFW